MPRSRRALILTLVVVLVAGAGLVVTYRAYADRCVTTFPELPASESHLPPRYTPADTRVGPGNRHPATLLDEEVTDGVAAASEAVGLAPFGTWLGYSYADTGYPVSDREPAVAGMLRGRVLVHEGGVLGGEVSLLDPATGAVTTIRGGANAGDSTLSGAGTYVAAAYDHGEMRAAAIEASGDLAWCTTLPGAARSRGPMVQPLAGGDVLSFLEAARRTDRTERAAVSRVNGHTGEKRWSAVVDLGAGTALGSARPFGDLVLVSPYGFDAQRWSLDPTPRDSDPVVALDAATGKERWRRALPPAFGGRQWVHGVVASTGRTAVVLSMVRLSTGAHGQHSRFTGIDQRGRTVWQVDDPVDAAALGVHLPDETVQVGDLLLVSARHGSRIVAYRIADGTIAWTVDTSVEFFLRSFAVAGDRLLVGGAFGIVVLDLRTGRQVGVVGGRRSGGHSNLNALGIVLDDRHVAVGGAQGIYVWKRAS